MTMPLFRFLFKRGKQPAPTLSPDRLKHILIIKPEKLGDMVITLPLVQAIRDQAPHATIDLLASPKGVAVVEHDPRFETVWQYRKHWLRDWRTIRQIRSHDYDVVIEMIDDDSSTGLMLSQWCARSAVRIGANKRVNAQWYDAVTDFHDNREVHAIDRALEMLPLLGLSRTGAEPHIPPFVPKTSYDKASQFLKTNLHGGSAHQRIAFNISGGKATRQWDSDSAATTIEAVQQALPDAEIILICAPHERERGQTLQGRIKHSSLVPADWSILDIAALLSHMKLVVSPDTSLVHLARSFKIPVVGLYPSLEETVKRWGPCGQTDGIVRSDDTGDIRGIDPSKITAEILAMLAKQEVGRA